MRDKGVRVQLPGRVGRVAALTVAAGALAVGGGVYAASTPTSTTRIDQPASAAAAAARVPSTTSTTSTLAPGTWTTRGPGTMLFPLDPLPSCFMHDNFGQSRGSTRTHAGTDISATLGREVYAVEDGVLYRQAIDGEPNTELSGNGWNLRGTSGTTYAFLHLSGFAPGLSVGSTVTKGQLIGYVGDTGNPGPGNYHLHFEVHPGGGAAVDPYPLLDIPTVCTG